jgi:hypothetical protein
MTQTAVDKFHDAVNDMIARRRPMTSNEAAKIWLECKQFEKNYINNLSIHVHDGVSNILVYIDNGVIHIKPNIMK